MHDMRNFFLGLLKFLDNTFKMWHLLRTKKKIFDLPYSEKI
jgi:hypothetical protein